MLLEGKDSAWRVSDTLGDEWHPDRSGIIVDIIMDDLPEGFALPGLRFTLLRTTSDLLWPPFVDLVTRSVAIRQPVFLCLMGPAGYRQPGTFLNVPAFVDAVESGDQVAIRRCLRRAGECLEMNHWERKSA